MKPGERISEPKPQDPSLRFQQFGKVQPIQPPTWRERLLSLFEGQTGGTRQIWRK